MVLVLIYLRERCFEAAWRIKRFCSPGEPSLLALLATTKEARVIFFSSRQVSGGLTVYFKGQLLARYIISGPLEGALEDTRSRFINHGWSLLCFHFFSLGHSSCVTRQVAIWSPGLMGTSWLRPQCFYLFIYLFASSSEPKAVVQFVLVSWNIYLHCRESSNYSFIHWQPSGLILINHPMNHGKCFTVIKYEPGSSEEWFICLDRRCSVSDITKLD